MSIFLEIGNNDGDRPAPSRAVCAQSGAPTNTGLVLWCVPGSVIEMEIEVTSAQLEDLGLDDAPPGISIWEGEYVWSPGSYEYPQDGSSEPVGKFRAPTDEEWAAIREGRNPWAPTGSEPT